MSEYRGVPEFNNDFETSVKTNNAGAEVLIDRKTTVQPGDALVAKRNRIMLEHGNANDFAHFLYELPNDTLSLRMHLKQIDKGIEGMGDGPEYQQKNIMYSLGDMDERLRTFNIDSEPDMQAILDLKHSFDFKNKRFK